MPLLDLISVTEPGWRFNAGRTVQMLLAPSIADLLLLTISLVRYSFPV
ncbi:hypothetical protein PMI22_04322 [Pseudomonas sp. GM21]|nr:hypothetical protein PMI22_04322 [Pseudomonas sp. GM21]